jgi:hypothetical protein
MEKIKQDAAGQNQKPEFLGFPDGACKKVRKRGHCPAEEMIFTLNDLQHLAEGSDISLWLWRLLVI